MVLDELFEFDDALGIGRHALLMTVGLALEIVIAGNGVIDRALDFAERAAEIGDLLFLLGDLGGERVGLLDEIGDLGLQIGEFRVQKIVLVAGEAGIDRLELVEQLLVAAGFAGLALERDDLAFDFLDDVGDADEVGFRVLEFAERLFLLVLVFVDARGFFEDRAAIFGVGAEDLVDLALGHERVARTADARVHEQALDVAESAGRLVNEVLAVAVAVDAAGDGDLGEIEIDAGKGQGRRVDLGKGHTDLGEIDGLAAVGAIEDHIGHLAAAQRLSRLFAEHPADGVGDVGFAAAVRTDNGGYARQKLERCLFSKRLEADELNALQIHDEVPTPFFGGEDSGAICESKQKTRTYAGGCGQARLAISAGSRFAWKTATTTICLVSTK